MCLLCPFYFVHFFLLCSCRSQRKNRLRDGVLLCYRLRKCSVHDIIKLAGKIPFSFLVSKCNPGKTTENFPCILPSPLTAGFYFCERFFFFFYMREKFKIQTNYLFLTCFSTKRKQYKWQQVYFGGQTGCRLFFSLKHNSQGHYARPFTTGCFCKTQCITSRSQ